MHLRGRVRLFLSRFKLTKDEYEDLISILEGDYAYNYLFKGDLVFTVATNKRKDHTVPIRAVFKEGTGRGIVASIDGVKMLQDAKAKIVMEIINEWNKELYASRNAQIRRDHLRGRNDKGDGSTD